MTKTCLHCGKSVCYTRTPMPKELMNNIEELVCQEYGITRDYLKAIGRQRKRVEPRYMVWKLLHENNVSLKEIGRSYKVSYKKPVTDHTTVISGIKRLNDLLSYEDVTISIYNNVKNRLNVQS